MSLENLKAAVGDFPDKAFVPVVAGDVVAVAKLIEVPDNKVRELRDGSANAGKPTATVYLVASDIRHLIAAAEAA